MSNTGTSLNHLKGIGVSPGVAVGPIRKVINVVSTDEISASPREIFDALNKVGEDLDRAAATIELDVAKEVLSAQSMIAQDPALVEAIGARLDQDIKYPDVRADVVAAFARRRRLRRPLARRGTLCRNRQRLCEGRPGLHFDGTCRPHRRGRGEGEPARLAGPVALQAGRHSIPASTRQDRSRHRDPARRDPQPARFDAAHAVRAQAHLLTGC
mgnify:CR=1 FL=1